MGRNVVQALLDIFHRYLRRIANLPLSRTETAIHRALARDEEEYAIRVAMGDARHRRHSVLIQRIVGRIEVGQFDLVGHALEPDRIALMPYEREIVRVYASLKEVVELVRDLRLNA